MRTVREEGPFPPEGRCGKKRRFREKDGTGKWNVSARRTVREEVDTLPPLMTVRRWSKRFRHEDGTHYVGQDKARRVHIVVFVLASQRR